MTALAKVRRHKVSEGLAMERQTQRDRAILRIRAAFSLGLAAIAMALSACAWMPFAGEPREGEYGGPPMEVSARGEAGYIVMRAPHGGWSHRVDRVERVEGGVQIYVTALEPDPGRMYTQAITEQWLATGTNAGEIRSIQARVRRFGKSSAEPYFEVYRRP